MISDASDESSEAESMEDPRRHIDGGCCGGMPATFSWRVAWRCVAQANPRSLAFQMNMAGSTQPRHSRLCAMFQQDVKKTLIGAAKAVGLLAGLCSTVAPGPWTPRRGEEEVLIGLRVFCLR